MKTLSSTEFYRNEETEAWVCKLSEFKYSVRVGAEISIQVLWLGDHDLAPTEEKLMQTSSFLLLLGKWFFLQ